ncbi:RHS repeat-associated core domain-containing protein [Xanthomonas euvesicatoria]|uniref:RHS repeat-associated core domain-containing protein n=1 Tax=Xanthomonas euvesicatoria TaxID=456327 RepID=UPI001E3977D2|nr:RHS repeat-associated core domain-containing protein [Xanthomonas euvesicatoria]
MFYDALGRRTAKTEGGTSTQYLYDGLDTVQETQGTTVNPILTGLGIDQRYARNDTGGRTYFLTDQLGSTRLLTNAAGSAVQRYEYDPYGTTTQSSTAYTNPYQYTGREKDLNGLYYYRARYYRPQWGRFISEDPIKLAGGVNMYGYVDGNPVNSIDPLGLMGSKGVKPDRRLTPCEIDALSPYLPKDALADARVHEGLPWFVVDGFNGITIGSNIYPQNDRPNTASGIATLGHEVTHSVQQALYGTTFISVYVLQSLSGLIQTGNRGDAHDSIGFEKQGINAEQRILADIARQGGPSCGCPR